jgi:hypothetical protein
MSAGSPPVAQANDGLHLVGGAGVALGFRMYSRAVGWQSYSRM